MVVNYNHKETKVGASSATRVTEGPLTMEKVREKQRKGEILGKREKHLLEAKKYGTLEAGDKN